MFYGPEQASIHHTRFGQLAHDAATLVRTELARTAINRGTVVDLGSGSGIFAAELGDAGYDVIGIDISADMVELARTIAPRATFTVGSLHDAELPPAVAVVALGEALNYATDPQAGLDALRRLARRVRSVLAPGGLFVFDVATPGRHGGTGRRAEFHDAADWALGMIADESADGTSLERRITIFSRAADGSYIRTDEVHELRLYERDAVRDALLAADFDVEIRTGYREPASFSGWNVFIAR